MGLNLFYLELTTKCINCGDIIAINAAVNKVWCSNCKGETKLGMDFYNLLFGEVYQKANKMSLGEENKTVTEDSKIGLTRFVYKKRPPACKKCKDPLPLPTAEDRKIKCSNCNQEHTVRKITGEKDETFIILGEDEYQVAESKKQTVFHEPVEFECTNCGGAMKCDGSERMNECPYCSSMVILPDALWYRLHPSAHLQPWYLIVEKDKKEKPWEFEGIDDMYYKDNILYCFGENRQGDYAIWAMTTDNKLNWMKVLPEEDIDKRHYSRIEYLEENKILLWSDDLPSALIYDAKTGDFIEEIGGYEPHDADKHYLDLSDCESLATDPNGTIVAFINNRIVRFSSKGEGVFTWPPKKNLFGMTVKEHLKPIYKNSPESIRPAYRRYKNSGKLVMAHKLKNRSLYYSWQGSESTVQIDHEGSMCVLSPMKLNTLRQIIGGAFLTKFDKEGEILFKVELPVSSVNIAQVQIDARGNIFVILNDLKAEREKGGCMFKVSPNGKEIKEIIRTHFGALQPHMTSFVVDDDGNIYTCNDSAEIRNYNNEGSLIYRNQKAIERDKENLGG